MSQPNVQMVDLSSIEIPSSARKVEDKDARKLARTIPPTGEIFQPIGLVPIDEEKSLYRLIWGGHRYRAYQILGREKIPANILSKETTKADEAKYSLVENSTRKEESPEELLARLQGYAKQLGVSISEAAKFAEIRPAYLSRCKAAATKLSPVAKKFAKEHKLGISTLYLIATKAKTPEKQLEAMQAYVAGMTRDELVLWLDVQTKPSGKPKRKKKQTKQAHAFGETKMTITSSAESTCGQVASDIKPFLERLLKNPSLSISQFS